MKQTSICQNCKGSFVISGDDFDYYERAELPRPTFCARCRLVRRLALRNERTLYKRACTLCSKVMISVYDDAAAFPVYCRECYWGDSWDAIQFGKPYEFSKPFFEQYAALFSNVPRPNLLGVNAVNSDYCNYFGNVKSSYLCFGSVDIEDCLYGSPYQSKNCVDTHLVRECEWCYECIDCEKLSYSLYSQDCSSSYGLLFACDCKNCHECVGCVSLRNKQYCIFNVEYTKEEYQRIRAQFLARGRAGLCEIRERFIELKKGRPHRYATLLQCSNVTGDHLIESKNTQACFDAKHCEDARHSIRMIEVRDAFDTNYCEFMEDTYEYIGFWKSARVRLSHALGESYDMMYCDLCSNAHHSFGCVGVRSRSYCILNFQHTKEEYEDLMPRIRAHMNAMPYFDSRGRVYPYGEFFPVELSPFAYNESVAQEYFPISEEVAYGFGFRWKQRAVAVSDERRGISSSALSERIQDVSDSLTQGTIQCAHGGSCAHKCTGEFRIIPRELDFYRRMQVPLPEQCPNCRHFDRLARRNPFELWERGCECSDAMNTVSHAHSPSACATRFETPYAPERAEVVYCEPCYQAEVA